MSTVDWVDAPEGGYTRGLHVTTRATSGSMVRFTSMSKPIMEVGAKYRITWVSTNMGSTSNMVVLNFNDSDKPVATPIAGTSLYRYTYESRPSRSFEYIVLYNLPNGEARDFTIYEMKCELLEEVKETGPVVRTDYHEVTYAEMLEGYTYDWSQNNAIEMSPVEPRAKMTYYKISEMNNYDIQAKLLATGKYTKDYALHYYNPEGGMYIDCLDNTGLLKVGTTYTITFEAYFISDSLCWLTMNSARIQNGEEHGISWEQLTDVSSDGKYWRATVTFTAKEGDASLSLYAKSESEFYISYMTISAQE
jgi:hypothetical protein